MEAPNHWTLLLVERQINIQGTSNTGLAFHHQAQTTVLADQPVYQLICTE